MNMKIFSIKYLILFSVLFSLFFVVIPAFAYDPNVIEPLNNPMGTQDVPQQAGSIIGYVLSIVGSAALVIFIYGGFRWMTASGKAEQVQSAQQIMLWAGLGVAVIFGSYIILSLVFKAMPAHAAGPLATTNLPNPLGENTTIPGLFGRFINGFLGITGTIALVMFIYGGITWLTSGGVPDKIKKGKDIFLWSVVGLIIIFSSYLMVDFVIKGITAGSNTENCTVQAEKTKVSCLIGCGATDSACKTGCEADFAANSTTCKK